MDHNIPPRRAANSTTETIVQVRCEGCIPAQRTLPLTHSAESPLAKGGFPAAAGAFFSNCVPVAIFPASRLFQKPT
jgi:hypothetical protein